MFTTISCTTYGWLKETTHSGCRFASASSLSQEVRLLDEVWVEVEETKWRAKSVTKLETSPVVLPSWELTCYPSQPALLKMIFLKVGYYLLVSWRVKSKKNIFVDITGFTNTMMQYVYTFWTNNQPNYHFCLFMNFLEIWGRFKFLAGIDSGTCVYK